MYSENDNRYRAQSRSSEQLTERRGNGLTCTLRLQQSHRQDISSMHIPETRLLCHLVHILFTVSSKASQESSISKHSSIMSNQYISFLEGQHIVLNHIDWYLGVFCNGSSFFQGIREFKKKTPSLDSSHITVSYSERESDSDLLALQED